MHQDEGVGGEYNRRLKDFARMRERLIDTALANRADLNEVLFGVEKDDAQGFAIQKAHLGTEIGDGLRTIDRERLTFLAQCDGAHAQGTNQSQGFRAWNEG